MAKAYYFFISNYIKKNPPFWEETSLAKVIKKVLKKLIKSVLCD